MAIAFLASGQGAQHPDMFVRLGSEPRAMPILEMLSERLHFDVRRLHETPDALDITDNRIAQLLLTGHCLAVCAMLDVVPDLSVGYSVGEIAACAVAGAISPQTAFDLIDARSRAMDAAREQSGVTQGMLAVIGILEDDVRALAARAGADIAIVNGADHVVVGGSEESLGELQASPEIRQARTLRRLPVRVASHTPMMADAARSFAQTLDAISWRLPEATLISGMDGRPIRTRENAVAALSRQMCETLNFRRCVDSIGEYRLARALEIGPGRALTRIFEGAGADFPIRAYEDFKTRDGIAKWLTRDAA